MTTILITTAILGGLGLLLGLLLSLAGIKFKVYEAPELTAIKDLLPGANCGGCGQAGCAAFAEELYSGKGKGNFCPVGDDEMQRKLADMLGKENSGIVRKTAFVRCIGKSHQTKYIYTYQGIQNCQASLYLTGGSPKACVSGCTGGGNCAQACMFGAINIIDGVAVINEKKCAGCTMCVEACPRKLIVMVPFDKKIRVGCNSNDDGKSVRNNCAIGCIGCRLCLKNCPADAINMDGTLAVVDYEKCIKCKACADACPRKCILK